MKYKMIKYINNAELKKEIKKIIIENDCTQKEIAEKLEMSPQTYNTLINKKNFSFADMQRILNALGYELYLDFRKRD